MNLIQNMVLSNIFIILIYLVYKGMFSRERYFQANRAFLLAVSAAALIMPWISPVMEFLSPASEIQWMSAIPVVGQETVSLTAGTLTEPINTITGEEIALGAYIIIMATIAILNTFQWIRLLISIRKAPRHRHGRLNVIVINSGWSAFSYFRTVFYPKPFDPSLPETKLILEHEQVHARQLHTLDNLFFGALRMAFFFNPCIHLLHKELMITHEYLADEHTSGGDTSGYSRLLISHQFKVPHLVLTHPFNKQSFLKRRLNMLSKNKQNHLAGWKYLLLLPLIGGMILGSSWSATAQDQIDQKRKELTRKVEKELKKIGFEKTDDNTWKKDGMTIKAFDDRTLEEIDSKMKAADAEQLRKKQAAEKQVFLIVEDMPTFQGGTVENFRNWVQNNVQYPDEAKAKKIAGTEYVSFVVDTLGNVTNPNVIRSADPLLSAEVIRVMKSAPAWIPGRQRGHLVNVSFSIPVKFVLDKAPVKQDVIAKDSVDRLRDAENIAFIIVEEMPVFQGGDIDKFVNWAQTHVKYPYEAMEKSLSGTVEVSFIVNKKGQVENVNVAKSADPVLDKAAVDVVNSSPEWTPGKQKGHEVKVSFRIPIKFELQ
jgi:TonB family protein